MIVVMLRTPPQRRQSTTDSRSSQPLHTDASAAKSRPRERSSAGPIAQAFSKFLELPVPVVLLVLWIFGAVLLGLLLGMVLVTSYWAAFWLLAAIAQLSSRRLEPDQTPPIHWSARKGNSQKFGRGCSRG